MRKSSKLILVAAALAALAVPSVASANVAVDDTGVGSVGKGDVQILLGMNDGALQSAWKDGKIKFTSKYQMDNESRWQCSDGSVQSQTTRVVQSRALNVTAKTNPQGKVSEGWTLNGIDQTKAGSFVSGGRFGASYVGDCGPTAYATGFLPNVFTNTVLPGLQVNGKDLPNTPVALPAV